MNQRMPTGRKSGDPRPVHIEPGFNRYAEGSVLVKFGETHVLCTASLEESVPGWLKAQNKAQSSGSLPQGWVTAEYAMLPRATHTRGRREREKVSGRTHEIQRLVARALRGMVDLKKLGERSIVVDCDVLQADGGTRTASITGGCVALGIALDKLARAGQIPHDAWTGTVSAVSCGIKNGEVLVDLDYSEDSTCDVDMNFVVTGEDRFIEVQGTAEHAAFARQDFDSMMTAALSAVRRLREVQFATWKALGIDGPQSV